jgi:hypothetical protein
MLRMARVPTLTFILLPLAFAASVPLSAQSLAAGTLRGFVGGADGSPLHQVRVMALEQSTGRASIAHTDRSGAFEIEPLPPGEYELLVETIGYRPLAVREVPVRSRRVLDLHLSISPGTPPFDAVEEVTFSMPALGGALPATGQWFSRSDVIGLPGDRRAGVGLGRLSSRFGEFSEVDGLPSWMTGTSIAGIPLGAEGAPAPIADVLRTAHRSNGVEHVELVTGSPDVEWSGGGGGFLNIHPRRGTEQLAIEGYGGWSGDAVSITRSAFGPGSPHHGLDAGAVIRGALGGGSARFAMGAEAVRLEVPYAATAGDTIATHALRQVQTSIGTPSADGLRGTRTDLFSAFGTLDLRITGSHDLLLHAGLQSVPRAEPAASGPGLLRQSPGFEGSELVTVAALGSPLGERTRQDVRLSAQVGRWSSEALSTAAMPGTRIAATGLFLGADPRLPDRYERVSVRLGETVYYRAGAHRLKAGLSVELRSYLYSFSGPGEFLFAHVDDFERRQGLYRPARAASEVTFALPALGFFLQDAWVIGHDIELTGGFRYDLERLPGVAGEADPTWLEYTGISTAQPARLLPRLQPRIGFEWDPGTRQPWRAEASAGIFGSSLDPLLLAGLFGQGAGVEAPLALGVFPQWPLSGHEGPGTRNLILAEPGFTAPVTTRATAGVTRFLGGHTALHLSGTYLRSTGLPRRRDLNLLPDADGSDQHGRPVFGTLMQAGGMLAARPGSNRRFTDYGEVALVESDGWLEHTGATVAVERLVTGSLRLMGSYTASRTRDNWPGGSLQGQTGYRAPFPVTTSGGLDWRDGTSDLDVPHRFVAAGMLRLPSRLSPELATVYRFRSGSVFTPGFFLGVDANGDGYAHNDPAFVVASDHALGAFSGWNCLDSQAGRFADRNSCRTRSAHQLDLRLTLPSLRFGRYRAEAVVDVLNFLAPPSGDVDRALYQLDSASAVQVDPATGRATIPLLPNTNFGRPFAGFAPDRLLRIVLQLAT